MLIGVTTGAYQQRGVVDTRNQLDSYADIFNWRRPAARIYFHTRQ